MNGNDSGSQKRGESPPEDTGGGLFEKAPDAPRNDKIYRVLARKYRPTNFDDLIGQEATVRILRRAFALGRVAHAFMFTGVRGVGKTTTARILARALNCIGPDGKGGPTVDPCGECPNCRAILADRHPDVLEIDAASRTGVDDMREIIDATRFRPLQGRMKVFIIDEVHMLSRNAFNALLKTLEEPPESVTFIFATTELRKVPVTVLSRCQRFDLRRVSQAMLVERFAKIAAAENVTFSDGALALIARAADGSVRDGLSLLDQAVALSETDVSASDVAEMLGLANRNTVLDVFDALMRGEPDRVLEFVSQAFDDGVDLTLLITDLLDLIHTVVRLKHLPALTKSLDLPEAERVRGAEWAKALPISALDRVWQILARGLRDVECAGNRRAAVEMLLLRVCYASAMPTPDQLAKFFFNGNKGVERRTRENALVAEAAAPNTTDAMPETQSLTLEEATDAHIVPTTTAPSSAPEEQSPYQRGGPQVPIEKTSSPNSELKMGSSLRSWRQVVNFVGQIPDPLLHGILRNAARVVRFSPPEISINLEGNDALKTLKRLQRQLEKHFPGEWRIIESHEPGEPTLDEQGAEVLALRRDEVHQNPLVAAVCSAFPEARVGIPTSKLLDQYGLPQESFVEDGLSSGEPKEEILDPDDDHSDEE